MNEELQIIEKIVEQLNQRFESEYEGIHARMISENMNVAIYEDNKEVLKFRQDIFGRWELMTTHTDKFVDAVLVFDCLSGIYAAVKEAE